MSAFVLIISIIMGIMTDFFMGVITEIKTVKKSVIIPIIVMGFMSMGNTIRHLIKRLSKDN